MRATSLVLTGILLSARASAGGFFGGVKPILDTRLRFENVDQDPSASEADALTFRIRAGFETLAYAASYATQSEWGDNPLPFDLDYRFVQLGGTRGQYSFAAGIELLEGDGTKGFGTPLATLHKFQGWADRFLAVKVPVAAILSTDSRTAYVAFPRRIA